MSDVTPEVAEAADQHPTTGLGVEVDHLFVEIDYAILQHFSKHLYASPSKAIEELVTNGYDALAQRVDVFLPGVWADDCLLTWDDGTSMDVSGLRHLWWIARSPKADVSDDRIAVSVDGKTRRRMVGKFGIGKLASYAIGDRLAHLCRRGDDYLLVSVDYQQAPPLSDEPGRQRGFSTPVRRLDADTAGSYVRSLFNRPPDDLDALLARPHWTLAIVDGLKPDIALPEGRLRWVLGNGMPLRPDFQVRVNTTAVTPTATKTALDDWHLGTTQVQRGLTAAWEDASARSEVTGTTTYGTGLDAGETVDGGGDRSTDAALRAATEAWAELPGLGRVRARLRLFDSSLREGRAADHGRSEGFFVYVKGRLLNPDDPKLLLPDPSFGSFNRMQATIWADGLDAELLADRERLQRQSPTAIALAVLQQALYLTGRARLEAHDDEEDERSSPITTLPAESREFFRQPLTALALRRHADGDAKLDPTKVRMDSESGSQTNPLIRVEAASNRLVLNTGHPLYNAVRNRVGDTRKGREALRLVELLALSDLLLEGHLLDVGVAEDTVDAVMDWRAGQLRSIAVRYENSPDQVITEAYDASYPGAKRFERARDALVRLMGFTTDHDGVSGKKDVLVVAPLGEDQLKFTVEAKGSKNQDSKGPIPNDKAEISGASAHAKAAGASFALVVAREFAGFGRNGGQEPAVLQECRTQDPPVAIVTVGALATLYKALQANHYPLTSLVEVLRVIEPPAVKLAAIQSLRRPTDKFDVRDFLNRLWQLQGDTQLPVSLLMLRGARQDWRAMSQEAFERVVFAVDTLSGGLLTFNTETYSAVLQNSPEIVADAVESALAAARDDEARKDIPSTLG